MLQIKPVASASPNGDFHDFRETSPTRSHMVLDELDELLHRMTIVDTVSERGIYLKESVPQASQRTIGFRKDVQINENGCNYRRGFKSKQRPSSR